MVKIITIYPNFSVQGGAQNVAFQLAEKLNDTSEIIILTDTPQKLIHSQYKRKGVVLLSFSWKNVRILAREQNCIFLSHHRKSTTILYLYLSLLGKREKMIHVAHSVLESFKYMTLFPKHIVAVSHAVKANLISYFGVREDRISVIYNGIPDLVKKNQATLEDDRKIRILFPARIDPGKNQLRLVREIACYLPANIELYFAGIGPEYEELKQLSELYVNIFCLGFVDIEKIIQEYDYVMLFSQREGFGLALVEGLRSGLPLITNKIPVFYEINQEGSIGYMFENFDELIAKISLLVPSSSLKYKEMSKNARLRYENLFAEEQMLEKYRLYINKLL